MSAQEAFEIAALTADPNEPSLAATTVSPQLDWSRALLEGMQANGQVARGPVTIGHPSVSSLENDRATVHDCEHDAEIVVSAASGQPAPGVPGQVDFESISSTMQRTVTGWKLMTQSVGVGRCGGS